MQKVKKLPVLTLVSIVSVLLVVVIMAISIAISSATKAREDAFRIEATKVVVAGIAAKKEYEKGTITIDNDNDSCVMNNAFCVTVKKLVELGLYDQDSKQFKGKVNITIEGEKDVYGLYLKKNDEFKIIGGIWTDYSKYGLISNKSWDSSFEICKCE